MSTQNALALKAVEELELLGDEDLYAELGSRLTAVRKTPDGSDKFAMVRGTDLVGYGPMWDAFKDLGKRFFARWSQNAYNLLCGGDDEDKADRAKIETALSVSREAAVTALALALTSAFGLAAGLATVVASIAMRLFFKSSRQAVCDVWAKHLPA
jgi:hypothetical protein